MPQLIGALSFGLSLIALFAASTAYHDFDFGPETNARLRRLDHAAIYLLIAGTYIPTLIHLLSGTWRLAMLTLVVLLAVAGVLFEIVWFDTSSRAGAILYVAMGWLIVLAWAEIWQVITAGQATLLISGGLIYTGGALVYALKWPDPWPKVFGFHESTGTGFCRHQPGIMRSNRRTMRYGQPRIMRSIGGVSTPSTAPYRRWLPSQNHLGWESIQAAGTLKPRGASRKVIIAQMATPEKSPEKSAQTRLSSFPTIHPIPFPNPTDIPRCVTTPRRIAPEPSGSIPPSPNASPARESGPIQKPAIAEKGSQRPLSAPTE